MCLLVLTTFPALAAAANTCVPAPRTLGTPIDAPHAAFEAYVVEVQRRRIRGLHSACNARGAHWSKWFGRSTGRIARASRSKHSRSKPCTAAAASVEEGSHVMVVSESGGPFEIVEVLPKAQVIPQGPFAALAYAAD